MSIEQKIAQILAEQQKFAGPEKTGPTDVAADAVAPEKSNISNVSDGATKRGGDDEDNKRNNVVTQDIGGVGKKSNPANINASAPEPQRSIKEDVAALVDGEDLSEEFKEKAATIFEAAVLNRVKQEVAKLDEAYQEQLMEDVERLKEGLVEKVDGYLDYVVEQWMEHNEIALESGMKSEILEGFVGGLKSLFEQHYIDIPEEKVDFVSALEEESADLQSKLNEQFQANVDLKQQLVQYQIGAIVSELSEGLVDTDKEKFHALVEELSFEGVDSFTKKAQTIRESYFTHKGVPTSGNRSVVTDEPVALNEDVRYMAPQMKGYLSILDNLK